jgi:diadenylate cyclase
MDFILLIKHFFDWRALIDIALMAAGLYFLYRTLQRLGTWAIAAGILVAMMVYLLASLLDLKGIEWIFGNLSHVAVIALIIIFQPELRKIFERAASVRRSKQIDSGDEFISILGDALWKLTEKRQGAIVVLSGREPIGEWLSGGYLLDARPSVPLIMSIFDPNSPGHDGAIVISKGKITRFGVRLPISQSLRLSSEYGTRHHAAMGLAEKSDALVIVVSEERGKIAVFNKGKMFKINNQEKLAAFIKSHWREAASYGLDLPRRAPGWRKVAQMSASLALAVFFWSTLIIAQGEMLERVITVPVEFTASPSNLVLVGEKDKNVRLHISGTKSDLSVVNPSEMSVKLDLSKAVAGKQSFLITADNLRLPRNIDLLDVFPASIDLTLAEIVEQEIMIKPQLLGKLPGNLKIITVKVIPDKIKVLTPAAEKSEKPISLMTTPIYLDSIHNDTSVYCKVIAPPAIQPVEKRWPDVEVVIEVGQ